MATAKDGTLRNTGNPLRGIASNRDLLARLRAGVNPPDRAGPARDEWAARPVATPGQEQVWFFDESHPGTAVSNIPLLAEVTGPLDVEALRRTLAALVERHESLRTALAPQDGRLVPIPAPRPLGEIAEFDLRALPAEQREPAERRALLDVSGRPFDLAQGPLWRCAVIRRAEQAHLLVLVMHHIATDGYSLLVLQRELTAGYAAFAAGRAPEFRPLSAGHYDAVRAQRSSVTDPGRHLGYWTGALTPLPEPVDWPFAQARPAEPDYSGDVVALALSDELAAAVRATATDRHCSPFMVLLAAFAGLVYRHTGRTDFVIGMPSSGRPTEHGDDLVGYFVNMLPLRLRLGDAPTGSSLLLAVRDAALDAYAHRETPFLDVMQAVQPERRPGTQPVFQMVFTAPPALGSFESAGATFRFEEGHSGQALYDMEVHLPEAEAGRTGFIKYRTELYATQHIEALVEQYLRLLGRLLTDPELPIDGMPLVVGAERRRLLEDWNDTRTEFREAGLCLHELVERQVDAAPGAVAVVAESGALTYRELDERANRIAHLLRTHGVGRGDRVGLCFERSLDMVAGLLGVLKTGGSYVPLDPGSPAERNEFMAADAGVRAVLTGGPASDRAPRGVQALEVDDLDGLPATRMAAEVRPQDSAYVIYTSGSTGQPKGVVNSHRSVVNRLLWMRDEYDLDSSEVVLQKTPYSFDVSVWEFFCPLVSGGRLVMARPEGHKDPSYLRRVIRAEQVTTLHFVPSMLQVFLDSGGLADCASVRRVVCSGEALTTDLARRFLTAGPGITLHNHYGPTEAAIEVSHWTCLPDDPGPTGPTVPIGRPVANTRLYVLDRHGEPTATGVPGELHIGGVQVADGYVNRPGMTAERFVPDPFDGGRMYRTGDVARYRPDGAIEFLGRMDRQVKIRGFRIEPGEVEECLVRSGLVRQATVQPWRDEAGDTVLVGYVVPVDPADPPAALYDRLRAELPSYMVPAHLVPLPELPLNRNGKLDVGALPPPRPKARLTGTGSGAPATPTEERIAEIWREVLGVTAVGRDDNFFDLGGHSLRIVQVSNRVAGWAGIEIPLRLLLDRPTVAGLAGAVDGLLASSDASALPAAPVRTSAARDIGDLLDELDALSGADDRNPTDMQRGKQR